jgi:hypothetical protein
VPASVGGVNTLDALMRMPGEDCIYTYNLMPVERGLQLRQGYREWATGAGTGDVRTIISYESPSQSAGCPHDNQLRIPLPERGKRPTLGGHQGGDL